MAYTDIYTAAVDENHVLRKQTAVAMHNAAKDVINEDPGTANHANRLVWARGVTLGADGPPNEAVRWIWTILENATIAADPLNATDSDVQFVVNSLVNTFADRGT